MTTKNERAWLRAGVTLLALGAAACGSSLTQPTIASVTGGTSGSGGVAGAGGVVATGGFSFTGGNGGTAGAGGGSATCESPSPGETPAEHRAVAAACNPSPAPASDGGVQSCATSADCAANPTFPTCLQGACSFDQCLTDADCGPNMVCGCSSAYYGGNALFHPNVCVPASCHVDADCGSGGFCSPSRGGCGTFEGFFCHGPSDTCVDAAKDCAGCTPSTNACVYAPTVGHFTCGAAACAG